MRVLGYISMIGSAILFAVLLVMTLLLAVAGNASVQPYELLMMLGGAAIAGANAWFVGKTLGVYRKQPVVRHSEVLDAIEPNTPQLRLTQQMRGIGITISLVVGALALFILFTNTMLIAFFYDERDPLVWASAIAPLPFHAVMVCTLIYNIRTLRR